METRVKATLNRLDVVYDVRLRQLSFDLARALLPTLEKLYGELQSQTVIAASDVQVLNGATMGDVGLRLRLFSGAGLIEVRAEGWKATFERLRTSDDVRIVKACIDATIAGLSQNYGDNADTSMLQINCFLDVEGGRDKCLSLLQNGDNARNELLLKNIGANQISISQRAVIEDTKDGWNVDFVLSPSHQPNGDLWCFLNFGFSEGSCHQTFDERSTHAIQTAKKILESFDFELVPLE